MDNHEKVHAGFQRCDRLGMTTPCLCAMMVQVQDDMFVLDRCRRRGETQHPLEFKVYRNGDLSDGLQIYATLERDILQFVLPSNAIVNIRATNLALDLWMKPSANNYGKTKGLCGVYDSAIQNDFLSGDGVTMDTEQGTKWRGQILNNGFVNSWRPSESLIGGVEPIYTLLPEQHQHCACENNTCHPIKSAELCHMITGEEITNQLDRYIQERSLQSRSKRQVEDDWSNIDYEPGLPDEQLPSWPTSNGYSESVARTICINYLQSSALWDVCSIVVNATEAVEVCVLNILLMDSLELVLESLDQLRLELRTKLQA